MSTIVMVKKTKNKKIYEFRRTKRPHHSSLRIDSIFLCWNYFSQSYICAGLTWSINTITANESGKKKLENPGKTNAFTISICCDFFFISHFCYTAFACAFFLLFKSSCEYVRSAVGRCSHECGIHPMSMWVDARRTLADCYRVFPFNMFFFTISIDQYFIFLFNFNTCPSAPSTSVVVFVFH